MTLVTGQHGPQRRRGFTLIEALAAIMVMLIVIPVILKGFSIAGAIATEARQRADATALAQSKLDEIIALQIWQSGMSDSSERVGVYDYQCRPTVENWNTGDGAINIQMLNMTVSWNSLRGDARQVVLSTLVWQPGSTIQTTGTGLGGGLP